MYSYCEDIDTIYNDIVYALTSSGTECIPISKVHKNSTFLPTAGWNEYVKEHYTIAQDALWWWKFYNKSKSGAIYPNMKSSKAKLKYAFRSVRRSEEMIKADAMASDLLDNDYDSFWKNVGKCNSCKSIQSIIIGCISGESNITSLWKSHFWNILNANSIDNVLKNEIMEKLQTVQ